MRFVDVHCHLDTQLFDDLPEVIERAKKYNVKVMPAGINPETNRHVLELRKSYPKTIFPTLGLYPPYKEEGHFTEEEIEEEIRFIKENSKDIFGIGEIGMDYKHGNREGQEKLFRKMVELAIELDKPMIVHSRKAEKDVIDILEEYDYYKIVMHCFMGKQKLVERIRDNGWYFSIPSIVVKDEHFQRVVRETPIHLLLLETDSPFLSPTKKRNEPITVLGTAKEVVKIKRLPEIDAANLLYRNTRKLFGKKL